MGFLVMCLDMVCYASERQKDYKFTTLEYFAPKETTDSRFAFTSRTHPRFIGVLFVNAYSSSESMGMCFTVCVFSPFFLVLPALEYLPGTLSQVNCNLAILGQPKPVPSPHDV